MGWLFGYHRSESPLSTWLVFLGYRCIWSWDHENLMKPFKIHTKSLCCTNGKPLAFWRFSSKFDGPNFKCTYLRAQKELVGQMVIVLQYFECVLHAEQVFRAIGSLWIWFLDLVSFFSSFCYKSLDMASDLMSSSDVPIKHFGMFNI